jgi:peptide subunit release factor 1 (eRF1)
LSGYAVPPARLARWLARWEQAHGPVQRTCLDATEARFEAAAGALRAEPPFPPLAEAPAELEGFAPEPLLAHAAAERRVGVLLVRLGGYAAGVFEGDRLAASKVGSRLVKGRHRKGGSSARRFERRRGEQARAALEQAADVGVRVLADAQLDFVVLGGDRRAVDLLREDARLAPVFALAVERFLGDVGDPRRAVLEATPDAFRATILRPESAPGGLGH